MLSWPVHKISRRVRMSETKQASCTATTQAEAASEGEPYQPVNDVMQGSYRQQQR